ncbi:MAG: HAD-IA family hydrolase [Duncaniella sp.]|nr:HAD-IA family hydrolase [Muribaculum sp.]MCM1256036.1 HAD-IA family hydrolase [Duncaniella sp.]
MKMQPPYYEEIVAFLHRHHYTRVTPRAALIDMDGTLYDSMKNHSAAWYRLMTEAGIRCTRDEFYLYEGRTGASTINLLFNREFHRDATDEEKEDYYHKKTLYFNQLPWVEVMPGAVEMVSVFKDVDIKRVLVTGSGQSSLLNRIPEDFPGLLDETMRVTSRDVKHGKPHPEPYIRAMQLARVTPSQSIVVENAPLGVEAGDKAGAFTIGVTTGPIPKRAMIEAGAAIVFDSMLECADRLPSLLLSLLTVSVEK